MKTEKTQQPGWDVEAEVMEAKAFHRLSTSGWVMGIED